MKLFQVNTQGKAKTVGTQAEKPKARWKGIALELLRWLIIVAFFGVLAFVYRKMLYLIVAYGLVAFCLMLGYLLGVMVAEAIAARFHTYGRMFRNYANSRWG
jgi:hypothetical protein